ncbi:MAG: single-stranded-DNA-specific exonuclease RecJ [Chloroflexi bacterium]|nr:MAG: single-stranded-DNA-specific exonuclease RecJ [Chloroflexota bacterium]
MSMRQAKNWRLYPPAPEAFLRGVAEMPLLLQVLYNRGLRQAGEVRDFLARDDAVIENPYRLPDMEPAVARLLQAIERQETICVYGDFDADGVAATALLVSALQLAGGRAGPYIPDRVDEGYGLNLDAIAAIATKAQVLVTVDCGIRSLAEVDYARRLGLDVIITDHHSLGRQLPAALAVINPRRTDRPAGFDRLAGVGVAYRLAQALLRAASAQPGGKLDADRAHTIEQELLDLVALGTVADMMPLVGENRSLVQRGLDQLNRAPRPGIEALMAQADLRLGTVDATAISFRLAPRINAAGRLSHAKLAYRLLRTGDATEAFTLAMELESLNNRRRALTDQAQAEAEAHLAALGVDDPAMLFIHSPHLLSGIVGLVAGKLSDRFYRPVVVVEEGVEESRGSARSIAEFDISRALDEVSHFLVRHGGHSRAAGFTVRTAHLAGFKTALAEVAERELAERSDLRPTLLIDAEVEIDGVTWGVRDQFARLEPTGYDNWPPLLLSRGVRVRDLRTVGGGKHLRLVLERDARGPVIDAVAFQQGSWLERLQPGDRIDLVYQVEANEWQGRQSLQLNVQDLRPAQEDALPLVELASHAAAMRET